MKSLPIVFSKLPIKLNECFFYTVIDLSSIEEECYFDFYFSQLKHNDLLRILKTFKIHSYPECTTLISKNIYRV